MKKIAASDSRQSVGLKWKTRKGLENLINFEGGKISIGDINVVSSNDPTAENIAKAIGDYSDGLVPFISWSGNSLEFSFGTAVKNDDNTATVSRITLFDDGTSGSSSNESLNLETLEFDDGGSYTGFTELSTLLDTASTAKYIHHLTVTTSSGAYKFSYRSTQDLKCTSVEDLRSIMLIKYDGEEYIACCKSDLTSVGCLKVTGFVCKVGADDVTAVSDIVLSDTEVS